jgi:capsular polysaccharide transport system permease protein
MSSFCDSLMIQKRVIGALLMREILTRYGRHNIGFLWLFAEPMCFTLGVTVLWNVMKHHSAEGISITAFVLTGYSTILLWRNMPGRCVGALPPNHSLMHHRQVKPIDVYIARLILEGAGATISFVFLSVLFYILDLVPLPYDYLTMWMAWFLLAWYAASLSLLIGALSERTEVIEKIWHPIQYLLVPLSGSFFIAESLPTNIRSYLLINPTVNCAEMFRAGYFGPVHDWYYSVGYVIIFNIALMLFGLAQVRHAARDLVPVE